ncbi:hypothetical protein AFERRID_28100 [Acidithiobacillus ferridurans]|uniref:Uncharacterized protein n=1 Tax=Acidithiobacillus ferridurans TaxID=1232575 RepID=A0A2Z6IM08_ACIFI|nr:hypothetical protein AFERRID_28100 [Acidithiobacillus ferridurans]
MKSSLRDTDTSKRTKQRLLCGKTLRMNCVELLFSLLTIADFNRKAFAHLYAAY